jgi:glycosyltransferase involved in cell wall biosynthesis
MYLSAIIPAYNEVRRLNTTLRAVHACLQQPYAAEIIAIENL